MRPVWTFLAFVSLVRFCCAADASPSPRKIEVATAVSLSGEFNSFGTGSLEGLQLAIEEANARGDTQIELTIYDDKSTAEGAREAAEKIVKSPALFVIGPSNTVTSLAAGPRYAQSGLASITTTATSDLITDNATTFRLLFKNSEQGQLLATYLARVLGHRRAAVITVDDGYGRTLEKGFRATAERLGIDARYYVIKSDNELESVAAEAAPEIKGMPVVLAMLDAQGAKVLPILRRFSVTGPFLGGDAFGIESFNSLFAGRPEEVARSGHFLENVYGITPSILDSANAENLAFAERFKMRFGHNPGWVSVAGFDAGRLAVETIRAISDKPGALGEMRASALSYLLSLKDPRDAPSGLLGPLVFDGQRGRQMAIRVGRFVEGRFESAPLQIVPAADPPAADVKSGAVFEIGPGKYVRLQQVIYSGLYLNELMWIDQARFTFSADFYIWLRFAKNNGPDAADPLEIKFPDLSNMRFDREHPVEQRELEDGGTYVLWRVQGEFRNQFDLRHYPFDREAFTIRFVHVRAAADRIVYALDPTTVRGVSASSRNVIPTGAAEDAFRRLSQWKFIAAHQQRENFVAKSSLGDPRRTGHGNFRELSGYAASFEMQRRSLSTVTKNMLPLLIMTCILYASLHFPAVLVQAKIGVAMTAILTGMVLLNSVNAQLGSIGYTVAVEYAFYVYFGLGLLHIVSVLLSERLRANGQIESAARSDFWSRIAFLGAVLVLIVATVIFAYSQH
jgi:branched-chain amino acid transport system substrate-binding protein